jgi:dihydrodipicolinate synthase/N-acetylneuraminate lyase
MKALTGIWTPTLVPLDTRGRINEQELRRFIDWLIASGIHGLFANGSTGEFTRFTSEERRRIAEITCDQARGRVPVLVGSAEVSINETLSASEAYLSMGARAVAVVAPFYFPLTPLSVLQYFRELGEASSIDVLLYNMPLFANPIDLDSVDQLSKYPRIIGIKDSSGDLPFMMRMIRRIRPHRPEFTFLTGWDPLIVPMLMAGATGGVNATSNVAPELILRMYDLTVSGNLKESMRLQYKVLNLFDRMFLGWSFPDGFRIGADSRGFDFGQGRQPSGFLWPELATDAIKSEIAEMSRIVEKSEHS